MPPSELRKEAREALNGKWGKAIGIILAYLLFSFAIGFVQGTAEAFLGSENIFYFIIDLTVSIISVPLSFGFAISFMNLKRDEKTTAFGFIKNGFVRFGRAWGVVWHTFIRLLLPIISMILVCALLAFSIGLGIGSGNYLFAILVVALLIATIVYSISRSLLYSLAFYIAYDAPELSSEECVLKSAKLMTGNRGNYLLLILSFIGWALLIPLTLGIGILWLSPYVSIAEICFYDRILNPAAKKVEEEVKIEE